LKKEKDEEDRKAKAAADIQAQKEAMARIDAENKKQAQQRKPVTTDLPKIKSQDYQDGITDETITEPNRTIYRTVVKKDGTTYNYQKVSYSWGGVFFFKNESSITQTTFELEIKNARNSLGMN
jgi:hypothetical protein